MHRYDSKTQKVHALRDVSEIVHVYKSKVSKPQQLYTLYTLQRLRVGVIQHTGYIFTRVDGMELGKRWLGTVVQDNPLGTYLQEWTGWNWGRGG